MRLRESTLGVVVNFLLGVAWALVLVGAVYTFFSFLKIGFFTAVIMAFFGALPGLFLIALLEYLIIGAERLDESRKQTELLKKILSRLESDSE